MQFCSAQMTIVTACDTGHAICPHIKLMQALVGDGVDVAYNVGCACTLLPFGVFIRPIFASLYKLPVGC